MASFSPKKITVTEPNARRNDNQRANLKVTLKCLETYLKFKLSYFRFGFSTECELLFSDETADSHLSFFPTLTFREKAINVPVNKNCSIYFGDKLYAQYLGCDGAWNEIPTQNVIDSIEATPGWSNSQIKFKVSVLCGKRFLN